MNVVKIHSSDNVLVALENIKAGDSSEEYSVKALEDISFGHKMAFREIKNGEQIIKYGCVIGTAVCDIHSGEWVHTHNVKTTLENEKELEYEPYEVTLPICETAFFDGYKRADGKVGIRNEIWVLPTVGCVNSIAEKLVADNQDIVNGTVDGLFAFPHPYGCSQLGDDHEMTKKIIAALAKHPNAGGVLIVSLGCENLTKEQLLEQLGDYDSSRIKIMVCQNCEDELQTGSQLLHELAEYASSFKREKIDAANLVVGLKCGGSDGLSGITANSVVGRFTSCHASEGGTAILTEVPEMFGAEKILFNRCINETVFQQAKKMVEDYKDYFVRNGQTVYENPSPGNKAGGITTLEDKSCGCVQKGGDAAVTDVLQYGETATEKGLNLLYGPGNDLVSTTALTAAGAHLILFTTGRGTPFGAPVPTVKVSSNSEIFERKNNWIDFNAGIVCKGVSVNDAGDRLYELVLNVASGSKTKNEINGCREIAIFKNGITL